ncbi:glycosyl transferase family 2 [Gloeothece citriformis PCC 7424]|uniref:Glycosyl transferase family 2 n=1 Tax=Gloeothece citriformis (strain PCC 7424) TaxID=65393 RepID=B7KJG1_GLOC7|nr:glycosyltransferase family A protein [Gloeothece citriformis]ACK73638.1 glycosyl transferase family 2 [Gloeothece citriformis PCC 7424]
MTLKLDVGIVAIGRNEGERLRRCLLSLVNYSNHIVYVDSGSTDESKAIAQSLSIDVVDLDLSIPFTAARARNTGLDHLLKINPQLQFVQFVDGDCEVVEGWLEKAYQHLQAHPELAVVSGRRRERFPEKTIYNRLCDMEWDTPVGESKYCGGDAMMRISALRQVEGYNPSIIAGEEPELCVRLRQKGWKIWRIDAEMTRHDAQMLEFRQWWKRTIRNGHAYAEGAYLHGKPPEKHWLKESRSIWLWGLIIPLLSITPVGLTQGWSLILLAAYPLLTYRIYKSKYKQGLSSQDALLYAIFCLIGKFPQLQGQIQFHVNRLLGKQNRLIEYKLSPN